MSSRVPASTLAPPLDLLLRSVLDLLGF